MLEITSGSWFLACFFSAIGVYRRLAVWLAVVTQLATLPAPDGTATQVRIRPVRQVEYGLTAKSASPPTYRLVRTASSRVMQPDG